MQHRKLDRLMTPVERIARVAAAGLTSATSSATRPSGAKSYDNADGTRTIIGNVANGESNPSYTMATHVGDVTAPGTPTGVTASSKSGVVVVEWDGTLSGGIPDDFFAVRVYLDGAELGILTGAGSVSSASLEGGTTHAVTATAEDDACLPDGTPAHNVSAPTAAISVTVSEGVEDVAAEVEQVRQDVADFRDDVATTYATKVEREDGDDAVKTWITTNYTNSNDLATTYATKTLVSQTKDAIELAASQTYETQSDAAATYATKSALTVGLDGIRSEVAEDYQPKGDYATTASMNSAIQQSASSIESSVAATYLKQSDAATTYATKTEVQQTASGLDTRITTAQSTADGAASTASTAAGNAATALSTANDALADSVEYIIGTQTAATNAWTGETRDAALVAGKTIAYKLPYAGTGTAATLNLTLSGGGTTGAKGVRRMVDNNANYTVTTQYGAGAVIQMTYDGGYWRVSSGYNPTNDINNARYRTQVPSAVKAAAAYTTGHIICGTSAGYKNIGAGVAFDLGYPLLYATASVAAGATGTGNYLEFENRNASTNGTIQSGAANKTLYLKGTVSGNTFTIAASPFMTTVVPTSEDGFCYIPLGLMYSATNIYFQSSDQLYAYTEGAFQPIGRGALATAQAEVTERQTLIRQFSGGVLAGYVGNAIAALVNAAGSFDVVSTTWSNGVPTVTDTLARYAANLVELGRNSTTSVIEFCGGIADLAYRGTSAILRSKTGSAGIQSGTGDLYETTQAALIASTLATVNDGSVQIQLGSAKPRLYAIADSVYLLDTSDPYTLYKEVDMYSLIRATNCRSEGVVTLWAGSNIVNVGTSAVSSFTLFTKAQLQAIVGTSWTPTGSNCSVFVMNGDYGVTDAMMSASINSSSVVRVHMNKTRTGNVRVNYLIVRIGG